MKGTVIVDTAEKMEDLKLFADVVRKLEYPNVDDPGHPFSYDIEVITTYGERLRLERKSAQDFVDSFLNGYRVDRQASAVDALLIEWSDYAIAANVPDDPGKAKAYFGKYEAAGFHLARIQLSMPVIITHSVKDTIAKLDYFRRLDKPLDKFENRIVVKAPTLKEKLVMALYPSVDRDVFEQHIEPLIDWASVAAAMHIDDWPSPTQVKNRIRGGLSGDSP